MTSTDPPLTHAGGVVRRSGPAGPEYLVVTASGRDDEWVLPKGHIEPGESPDRTAVREVLEEAGVVAEVVGPLVVSTLEIGAEQQRIGFFSMTFVAEGRATESRQTAWLALDEAVRRLTYPEARDVLKQAVRGFG